MNENQSPTLTALRVKGYSTGLFPTVPFHVSPGKKAATFKLAMGRTVRFNLISFSWVEESPEGKLKGKLSPGGRARLEKLIKKA